MDLGGLDRRLDDAGHGQRHAILNGEDVLDTVFEALAPHPGAGLDVHQAHGDAHPAARLAHAAFQQVAHPQGPRRLGRFAIGPSERAAGGAGDDEDRLDPRQGRGDLLDHAVGEIGLVRIAGEIGER